MFTVSGSIDPLERSSCEKSSKVFVTKRNQRKQLILISPHYKDLRHRVYLLLEKGDPFGVECKNLNNVVTVLCSKRGQNCKGQRVLAGEVAVTVFFFSSDYLKRNIRTKRSNSCLFQMTFKNSQFCFLNIKVLMSIAHLPVQ